MVRRILSILGALLLVVSCLVALVLWTVKLTRDDTPVCDETCRVALTVTVGLVTAETLIAQYERSEQRECCRKLSLAKDELKRTEKDCALTYTGMKRCPKGQSITGGDGGVFFVVWKVRQFLPAHYGQA